MILDEFGYVPASKLGTELLFDVISLTYERTKVIATMDLPFERRVEVLGRPRLTGAALIRHVSLQFNRVNIARCVSARVSRSTQSVLAVFIERTQVAIDARRVESPQNSATESCHC